MARRKSEYCESLSSISARESGVVTSLFADCANDVKRCLLWGDSYLVGSSNLIAPPMTIDSVG